MSRLWLQLGRAGDIMGILPLLHHDAAAQGPQKLMVAAEFAGLLEGVSYVEPMIYQGPHYEIEKAYRQAELSPHQIVCTQVNGPKEQVAQFSYVPGGLVNGPVTTSFQKEQWRIARRLGEWDFGYPLVFDRRNQDRERALLAASGLETKKKTKPLMLVGCVGRSSPVLFQKLLLGLLKLKFSKDYEIRELPQADRIFDLLVCYERASVLVSTDSMPLHLARAVPHLPVVAWIQDKPALWNGSAMQPQHIFYGRYGDWNERAIEMLDVIADARRHQTRPSSAAQILLIQNQYDDLNGHTPSDFLRLPLRPGACGRDSLQLQGEIKRLPFLRDCIKLGLQRCEPHHWICVARPNLDFKRNIGATLRQHEACYAYRIQDETFVPVLDLFCARKSWWAKFMREVPNFIFGSDHYWPQGLWAMFKKHGAEDVTGVVTRQSKPSPPAENPEPPRLSHNRSLCTLSMGYFKIRSRYPKVSEQVELLPLDTSKLVKHGYNPSIIENDGKILMAYRYHQGTPATQLAYATFDDQWRLLVNQPLEGVPGQSREDPKLFRHNDKIYFSFVQSTFPNKPCKSVVSYGEFGRVESNLNAVTPELPGNDWTTIQKNHVSWSQDGRLYWLYQCRPTQQIYLLGGPEPAPCSDLPGPRWPWGFIKGGCSIPFDGKLLRFFHSTLDNELDPLARRRYYLGAYLMNADTFEVLRVSKKPIIYGSETCGVKQKDCVHYKRNVVFPGGVIARDDHWLLSLGINDCQIAIAKITEKMLSL